VTELTKGNPTMQPIPNAPPKYDGEFLRCITGSELCGISQVGTSDIDLMGVCIEPPEFVTGLRSFEQHEFRTKPKGERSGPGDVDSVVYGLRKYMRLAVKGNPSVLVLLFVPKEYRTYDGLLADDFRAIKDAVIASSAASQFLGYMRDQKLRLMGLKGGAHVNRPELVERYGYDTKYASHVIRLGMQGIELMQTGAIELPMKEPYLGILKSIRGGGYKLDEVVDMANALESDLEEARDNSPLRIEPDYQVVNDFLHKMYTEQWTKGY
jgi:predicted nucleotidyltransferase